MPTDDELNIARTTLSVFENTGSNDLKLAYIQKINSLFEVQNKIPYGEFIRCLDKINTSLQMLINVGYKNASRFDSFTFSVNPNTGESGVSRDIRPSFNFDLWNPLQQKFGSFEFNYLSRSSSSRAMRYDGMKQYYLPYQCLYRLLYQYNQTSTLKNSDRLNTLNEYPYTLPICTECVEVQLVRTSQKGRSYNIDKTNSKDVLTWRITKENERYPYSIEILTQTGDSLGELPNDLSACVAPLLEENKINIAVEIINVDRRRDRGIHAKCSHLLVALHIQGSSTIPTETYFNVFSI